ncbi:periplasmic component of phospholipid ABC transporter [Candidatus Regiella insecticola LSR1]|uniref:Periplasmic component of phospholipid ABC transporter n=1 Tax=Candidatus Regiella insecticola LSR1 TaxID=663321 RepID=E0WRT5_9ENTR|nr:outer membrane lipid asymmetry maintenance protein MlaD [Candidatus Regiella insecticola]EFL92309.1 periplasmic component of phospholipid ABC transporter [Candidatus Regiella insecticola LSR1]
MQTKKSEIGVGLFVLVAFIAVIFLCLKVADIKSIGNQSTYRIYAIFNNVGGLKINSPVKIGGVVIGRVADISLDKKNYNPRVAIDIQENYNHIPNSSSLAIRTAGLLGEQFLALNVGFEDQEMGTGILKAGDTIEDTKSALILEDLIGQLIYKKDDNNTVANSATSTQGGF